MAEEPGKTELRGGCQCGAVRYVLTATPSGENICHCRMCQKAGGAPFMAFAGAPLNAVTWTRGAPKIFVSSAIAERGFCAECGTPLTYRPYAHDRIAVTIASLDDPAGVAPKRQFGVESKLPWIEAALTLPGIRTDEWRKLDEAALASRQHPDREV